MIMLIFLDCHWSKMSDKVILSFNDEGKFPFPYHLSFMLNAGKNILYVFIYTICIFKFLDSSPFSHTEVSKMSKSLGQVSSVSSHLLFHGSSVLWQNLYKEWEKWCEDLFIASLSSHWLSLSMLGIVNKRNAFAFVYLEINWDLNGLKT